MSDSPGQLLLRMEGIGKSFPGVVALRDVDLELRRGEVLALVGENGAGKSTLIKVLAGAHHPDTGSIHLQGMPVALRTPAEARQRGIAVIYQEFALIPSLPVADNVFLGRERGRWGWLARGEEYTQCRRLFARLGIDISPQRLCRDLSVAEQQAVEIARALTSEARILVMDEPTAPLTPREAERLFGIIRELKTQGLGIIFISHRLDEVFAIADRVTVLRDGQHAATRPTAAFTRDKLIERMVGRTIEQEFPARQVTLGPPRLVASNLNRGQKVRDVSLSIRAGEIVALTGLVGAGRTETARLLAGIDRRDGGSIAVDGAEHRIRTPREALHAGICLLPEDRKQQGLILRHSALHNFGLPNLRGHAHAGVIKSRRERSAFQRWITDLNVRLAHPDAPAGHLSGGNQQKVVLAKWLERNCHVLIFDEPTCGVDVGAKYEIYQLMNRLAGEGKAILMISSDLPEVLGMADRVLVMRRGRIAGEIADGRRATQDEVMRLAVG